MTDDETSHSNKHFPNPSSETSLETSPYRKEAVNAINWSKIAHGELTYAHVLMHE